MVALSVASLAGMLAVPSQVHAGADSSNGDILGVVGSDTTYYVMNALVDAHNLSTRYNPNGDKAVNIPPLVSANANVEAGEAGVATAAWLKAARLAWPGGAVLPADANCTTEYVFGGAGSEDTNQNGAIAAADDIEFTSVSTVPGGPTVNSVPGTYTVNLGVQPPNGSGDGRSAISGSAVKGVTYNSANNNYACLDIGRSSSYSADAAKYEYWAFALDAIGWTYFPGNSQPAVANGLTTQNTKDIYQCSASTLDANNDGDLYDAGDLKAGYPKIRYWNQLIANSDVDNVEPTKIAAYRIQAGSGTGKDVATIFFGRTDGVDSQVLADCDGYPSKTLNDKDGDTTNSFTFPIVQEHDCRNVSAVDKPNAICWYGYSRWVLQARSLETDKRNGAVFGKFGPNVDQLKRPSFSTINTSDNRYKGTRWIYNVIPLNAGADVPRSADARRFVGVSKQPTACATNATGTAPNQVVSEVTANADCNFDGDSTDEGVAVGAVPGFICGDATARRIIASFGFKPITSGLTQADDPSYGTSNCRRNQIALSNS
jgi:hypothetical protein